MRKLVQSTLNPVRHVAEDDLLPYVPQCPVCGHVRSERQAQSGLVLQDNPSVRLLICEHCSVASASRMPSDVYLTAYYASYYHAFNDAPKIAFRDIRRFARHIVAHAPQTPHISTGELRLLDYGGGDGRIAAEVAMMLLARGNWQTACVDCFDLSGVAPTSLQHPRISLRACSRPEEIRSAHYHGVIASAVFEHIPHPRPVMELLLSSLEPSAWLYARTPYVLPVLQTAQRLGVRLPFGFPAHLHDMGPKFWENCLSWLEAADSHAIQRAHPSIIETNWRESPLRTTVAWCLKQPWYAGIRRWPLVGGWEIWILRQ